MLEIVRAYARELLTGEAQATARAHAAYYLTLVEAAEQGLTGRDQRVWLDLLDREHDNLRAALGWACETGEIEVGMSLAGRLWRFWERRGHLREGLAWLEELLAHAGPVVRPETRARALNAAGNLGVWGDHAGRSARYEASLALYRELGDRGGVARALNNLGMVALDRDDFRAARALHEESLAIFRSFDDQHSIAMCLANLAYGAMELGDLAAAAEMLVEANAIRERLGDSLGLARSLMGLAVVRGRAGERERAAALMDECLRLCRELGDEATLAHALARRGDAARAEARDRDARRDYAEALALSRRVAGRRVVVMCIEGLAALAARQPAPDVAARLETAAAAARSGRRLALDEVAQEALAWARGG
jgi:tetratricopeptide (TPR) repeat protein